MILQKLDSDKFPEQFARCPYKLVLIKTDEHSRFATIPFTGKIAIPPKTANRLAEFKLKKQKVADTFEYCHREFGPPVFAVRDRPIDLRIYMQWGETRDNVPVLVEQSGRNYCWFTYTDSITQEVVFRFQFSEHCVMTRMVI